MIKQPGTLTQSKMLMKRLVLIGALTLLLAACAPSLPESGGGGGGDECNVGDLVAPSHTTPSTDYEIVSDLDHIFVWSYSSCEPDGWRVELTPHDPDTYNQFPAADTEVGLPVPAQTSWVFDGVMQPASAYEWRVAAFEGGVVGPYSETTIFWTGPICESGELAEPMPLSPDDESVIDTPEGPFVWDFSEGDCVPEFTFFELGTTPGFPGENLGTGLGPARLLTYPAEAMDDCTEYFWRVRNESDGETGPWSEVWSFSTDFEGACGDGPGNGNAAPMGIADRDLNCRAGDGTVFNETGFLAQGESVEILGRNEAGSWLLVPLGLGGEDCWLSAAYIELPDGVLDGLEVFASPPVPTATPTQPPIVNPFAVTAVSLTVDNNFYRGQCPERFTFTATITANGPGTVDFQWLRSDQAVSAPESLVFNAAGSQQVQSTWDISSGVHEDLWKQVEILSPISLLSNQALFSVYCST